MTDKDFSKAELISAVSLAVNNSDLHYHEAILCLLNFAVQETKKILSAEDVKND
jgi:hypothetical protein